LGGKPLRGCRQSKQSDWERQGFERQAEMRELGLRRNDNAHDGQLLGSDAASGGLFDDTGRGEIVAAPLR